MVKKKTIKISRNTSHNDIPATVGLVKEVRSELRAEIRGVEERLKKEIHEVKAEMSGIKSDIHEVKAEMSGIKSDIHEVKAEQHGMKAQIQEVLKSVHHTQVLMEEQRTENRIVLDGLKNMMERQDRIEGRQSYET